MVDIENLLSRLDTLSYPQNMLPVRGSIKGPAFFPGGTGILGGESNLASKRVMVLGQDFDCETNYKKSLENGRENIEHNATWRNLLSLLKLADIDYTNCFLLMQLWAFARAI
jgi:hypothetical protein